LSAAKLQSASSFENLGTTIRLDVHLLLHYRHKWHSSIQVAQLS